MSATLVVLGCGFAGTAVARRALARGDRVVATTRDRGRAQALAAEGIEAHAIAVLGASDVEALVPEGARVLVAFPPDGATDARVAAATAAAARLAYVSSTAVYGGATGRVDAETPVDASDERARARLEAEGVWRARGATLLRAAGIYGPGRGLHLRLARGDLRVPGGDNVVSRVHVDDLAAAALAALDRPLAGEAFVVADALAVPQREVIEWLAARMGLPVPPAARPEDVGPSLRHDRAIDASATWRALGLSLRFPTWREGFEDCLARDAAQRPR